MKLKASTYFRTGMFQKIENTFHCAEKKIEKASNSKMQFEITKLKEEVRKFESSSSKQVSSKISKMMKHVSLFVFPPLYLFMEFQIITPRRCWVSFSRPIRSILHKPKLNVLNSIFFQHFQ